MGWATFGLSSGPLRQCARQAAHRVRALLPIRREWASPTSPQPIHRRVRMDVNLKPLDQQVVVITGASSGICLATALAAAPHGASVVLAARSGDTLDDIVGE